MTRVQPINSHVSDTAENTAEYAEHAAELQSVSRGC